MPCNRFTNPNAVLADSGKRLALIEPIVGLNRAVQAVSLELHSYIEAKDG